MNADNTEIDTEHDIFQAFRAVGYAADELVDPGYLNPEDARSGDWRVVRWNNHGIEMFDIGYTDVVDTGRSSPYGIAVEYGNNIQQPIAFAGESGPLNADIPDMGKLRARSNRDVSFLAPATDELDVPEFSQEEAVDVLSFWGSEGWFPRETAEALVDAFDGDSEDIYVKDDPDADGLEIVRASTVAKKMAAGIGGAQSSDADITGHKKRRRQTFHRNLDALRDHVGAGE